MLTNFVSEVTLQFDGTCSTNTDSFISLYGVGNNLSPITDFDPKVGSDVVHLSADLLYDNPSVPSYVVKEATDHAYICINNELDALLLPSNASLRLPFNMFAVACSLRKPSGRLIEGNRTQYIVSSMTLSLPLLKFIQRMIFTVQHTRYSKTADAHD